LDPLRHINRPDTIIRLPQWHAPNWGHTEGRKTFQSCCSASSLCHQYMCKCNDPLCNTGSDLWCTDTSQSDCTVSSQLLRNPFGSALIQVVHKIKDLDGNRQQVTLKCMVGKSVLVAFSWIYCLSDTIQQLYHCNGYHSCLVLSRNLALSRTYMYVCVCVCVCCVYVCITCVCIYLRMYVRTYVSRYVWMNICVCMYMCTHIWCVYVCMYVLCTYDIRLLLWISLTDAFICYALRYKAPQIKRAESKNSVGWFVLLQGSLFIRQLPSLPAAIPLRVWAFLNPLALEMDI
jgi:hypothetical protein